MAAWVHFRRREPHAWHDTAPSTTELPPDIGRTAAPAPPEPVDAEPVDAQ